MVFKKQQQQKKTNIWTLVWLRVVNWQSPNLILTLIFILNIHTSNQYLDNHETKKQLACWIHVCCSSSWKKNRLKIRKSKGTNHKQKDNNQVKQYVVNMSRTEISISLACITIFQVFFNTIRSACCQNYLHRFKMLTHKNIILISESDDSCSTIGQKKCFSLMNYDAELGS